MQTAVAAGAEPQDLSRALCLAAALRVVRFGTANEFSDWDEAHHAFTYCHALHRLIGRVGSDKGPADRVGPELLRGIFHGAMAVYLNRFLNIPPARLPDAAAGILDELPTDAEDLRAAFLAALDRQNQVAAAASITARYLALGHPAGPLIETFAQAVLREDADFHTYQMLEAGIRTYQDWGVLPGGSRGSARGGPVPCGPRADPACPAPDSSGGSPPQPRPGDPQWRGGGRINRMALLCSSRTVPAC